MLSLKVENKLFLVDLITFCNVRKITLNLKVKDELFKVGLAVP